MVRGKQAITSKSGPFIYEKLHDASLIRGGTKR
jgi:hypothetical protein